MKAKLLCAFSLMAFLLLLTAAGLAAPYKNLYVTPAAQEWSENPAQRVNLYTTGSGKQYLFLPSGWDAGSLRLWFEGCEAIMIGDETVSSGDVTHNLVPGETVYFSLGKSRYKVQVLQGENTGALFINTDSGSMHAIHRNKNHRESGELVLVDESGVTGYSGPLSEIKGRGNGTFGFAKKPYQIKLDKATDLMGMGKSKTWILLADYMDVSLLRNKVTFALAQALNLNYTSQCRTVDLYLNGEYYGVYLLCEKVQIGSSRIPITDLEKATEELNESGLDTYPPFHLSEEKGISAKGFDIENDPEDITGGYVFELEKSHRYRDIEQNGFKTSAGQPVVIKSPEFASRGQVLYLADLVDSFQRAISQENGTDPETGRHYTQMADLPSLVCKYLVEEVSKNYDSTKSSQFFYKDSDKVNSLIYAGPAWDYDLAYGNFAAPSNARMTFPDGLYAAKDSTASYYWYPKLYRQADFYDMVLDTYIETLRPALSVLLGEGRNKKFPNLKSIREYEAEIAASARMNFTRWPASGIKFRYKPSSKSFTDAVDYLEDFISKRRDFLDEAWMEEYTVAAE